jgi:DNA repair exonuclease SbcCD nuclease subunit
VRRVLVVGDIHSTPEELADCKALMDFVVCTALKEGVTDVLLLGDVYHTHNVMRVEVLAFWRDVFREMKALGLRVVVLVGNHDFAGEGLPIHSLLAHEDQAVVIDRPTWFENALLMPYMSDRGAFVEACVGARRAPTVFCHQTFEGSTYENGMYAPGGVDPNLLPQENVISGHIHTPQSFGRVTYIGAPRWRSLADADVERAVWVYELNEDGRVSGRQAFDTGSVCRQIKYRLDTPDDPIQVVLDPQHDWRIDVKGPSDWVQARKAELAGPGIRLRTFVTDTQGPRLKESDGVGVAFGKFLGSFTARHGTATARLAEIARERLHV